MHQCEGSWCQFPIWKQHTTRHVPLGRCENLEVEHRWINFRSTITMQIYIILWGIIFHMIYFYMLLRNESFFKSIFILSSNFFHNTKFVEAMLFFLLAMLSCLLAPWTLAVLWYFLFPGHAEAQRLPPQPPRIPVTGPRFSEDDSRS